MLRGSLPSTGTQLVTAEAAMETVVAQMVVALDDLGAG